MENKVKVSERALVGRVRRILEKDCELLKTCRPGSRWYGDLGNYYIVDSNNCISCAQLDLEVLARELKVLAPYEVLEV